MEEKQEPRGIRNNNPLNIRYVAKSNWQGRAIEKKDPQFEEFEWMPYGYRAAFLILYKYMTLYNLRTPFQICARWAPIGDNNNPSAYAKFVCNRMGCGLNDELDFRDPLQMIRLASAMTEMENGKGVDWKIIRRGYMLAASHLLLEDALEEANKLEDIL